jgi:WD40 repeat protein/cellulose biosynthesis protein BcsQ
VSETPTPGSIITFYSYKGGTGRSMALANVGCLLAQRQAQTSGRSVLMVDWDLEAPGLHRFFRHRFRRKLGTGDDYAEAVERQPGLIDLFWKLQELVESLPAGQSELSPATEQELRKRLNLRDFVLETDIESLHLLKAGQFGKDYPRRVNTFGWEALYNQSPWLIPWFASWLAERYEYVLIDSRTGVTDTSGICTMLLPEKLAVVFTPNLQSTEGALAQIEGSINYRRCSDDLRPLLVFPLPSRIESTLPTLRDRWRFDPQCGYQPRFEALFRRVYGLAKCDLTEYFNEVQVPQVPDYAYGEEIAVLVERGADKFSLTNSYTVFTDRLLAPAEPWERPGLAVEIAGVAQDALRRAYALMARLSPQELEVARRVLTRLVQVSPGPEFGPDSPRRARRRDLDAAAGSLLDRMVQAGVVCSLPNSTEGGESLFELADLALISEWAQLRDWIEEDREFLFWRERLRAHLTEQERSGTPLTGKPLAEADRWLGERRQDLSAEEAAFIENALARQARRRRRLALAGLGVAVLITIIGAVAGWLGLKARREAVEARASSILAAQEAVRDPAVIALLAMEIDRLSAPRTKSSLDASRFAQRAAASALPVAILAGHEKSVLGAVFSPDGSHVVTASADGTARVWSADGSAEPLVLRGHQNIVRSAAFSPDGLRIVTSSVDGTARIWNADGSGKPIVLSGNRHVVVSAAFSPDGSRVVTTSLNGTARIWNADGSGTPIVLRGHLAWVVSAAFSPDGSRIVTASIDGTARIWNANGSGKPIVLRGDGRPIASAAFSPDGSHVITASQDYTARIWSSDGSGKPFVLRGHTDALVGASFSFDGLRVLTASKDGTARVWHADGSGETVVLRGHDGPLASAAFSPDGSRVVTASSDRTARVWKANGFGETIVLRGHEGEIWSAAFSRDGRRIVTASADTTARVWKVEGASEPVVFRSPKGLSSAAFSPDGSRVFFASNDGSVQTWKLDGSGQLIVRDALKDKTISAISADGSMIVTASSKGTLWISRMDGSGNPIILGRDEGGVRSATFSHDGSRVVTAGSDGTAKIWKADRSSNPILLRGHNGSVANATFSPDGSRVVTASSDGTARVWTVDGQLVTKLRGHEGPLWSAAFSPDGSLVVTASEDRTARIWKADGSGKPIVLRGHENVVMSAVFSPDGFRIATASADGTARIWNADGSSEPLVLRGRERLVTSVAFSPDGSRVVTTSFDGTARLWRVSWTALIQYLKSVTHSCLTPGQRMQYLGETPAAARAAYETCKQEPHRGN